MNKSPDERTAPTPASPQISFDEHVAHVQEFLKQMYAIMIDPVEDNTGNVADTCRLLLNAARRDRDTIHHLTTGKPQETSPSIEEQIAELTAAGWKSERTGVWRSSDGLLWRGPHGAWKAMTELQAKPEQPPVTDSLHPHDALVHLREWLNNYLQTSVKHFGESDASGHPHGYAGVVIPDWSVKQKLDEIEEVLRVHQ